MVIDRPGTGPILAIYDLSQVRKPPALGRLIPRMWNLAVRRFKWPMHHWPSRYSIFALRNLCELIGINPDGTKRRANRRAECAPSTTARGLRA